jgi:hypothetical protein
MYHYSHLLPKQVIEKCEYYGKASWNVRRQKMQWWVNNCYLQLSKPFRVHIVFSSPGWLTYYGKQHPPQIQAMWQDLQKPDTSIELRPMEDVQQLLHSYHYIIQRYFVIKLDYPARIYLIIRKYLSKIKWKVIAWFRPKSS